MEPCPWIEQTFWASAAFAAFVTLLVSYLLDRLPKLRAWWSKRGPLEKLGMLTVLASALQAGVYYGSPPLFGCSPPPPIDVVKLLINALAILAGSVGTHEWRKKNGLDKDR